MALIVGGLILLVLLAGPQWYVRHTLKRYDEDRPDLPGTGGELAAHLLRRFQLDGIQLEPAAEGQDHFDPRSQRVRLSPSYLEGRSLTAIAVAAHEVGHAIQHHRREGLMMWQQRVAPRVANLQRIGSILLVCAPIAAGLLRTPQIAILFTVLALVVMSSRLLMRLITLPLEWDASFGKALPILQQGNYLEERDLPAIRQILRAASLTYVAAALLELLMFWRWLRYIR